MPTHIDISQIRVGQRLRQVSVEHVTVLAASMKEVGLLQPVVVTNDDFIPDRFELVAGFHRMMAAKQLGWDTIEAVVQPRADKNKGKNQDNLRIAEIDENLCRHELNPLDRAIFLAERQTIYERLNPDSKQGGDRKSEKAKSKRHDVVLIGGQNAEPFTTDVAKKTGLDKRTIQRSTRIARQLDPELIDRLRALRVFKQGELLKLVELSPDQRKRVVSLLWRDVGFQSAIEQVTGDVAQEDVPQLPVDTAIAQIQKILTPFADGKRTQILSEVIRSMDVRLDESE